MTRGKDRLPKFEDAIAELESIIEQIEAGQCGLEECIAQYERGMKLVGRCQSILDVVQKRIAELTAEGGKLRVQAGGDSEPSTADEVDAEVDEVAGTTGSDEDEDGDESAEA